MKINPSTVRHFLTLCYLSCTALAATGQVGCDAAAEWQPGSTWVYRWYNADKKNAYTTTHRVLHPPPASDHREVQLVVVDAFQDTVHRSSYQIRCDATGVYQDLLAKLTPDMLRTLTGVSLRSTGKGWQLPIGMQPGDSIPQAFDHIEGFDQATKILEFDLAIGPVHILAREDLATPAGGFPCMTLAYELWVTQVVRKQFQMRDWYAPGVGVVRREVFDRRGKFFGYCELVGRF